MTASAAQTEPLFRQGSPVFDYALWLIYSLFIGTIAFYHEPWRDEVLALSIAKASTSFADLLHILQHEGHPPLWYLILKAMYGLFHTNNVLKISAWVIASLSALVFLRHAPFSAVEKILFLCGVCPLYDYAVVCREYGIAMLMLFLLSAGFDKRFAQPWRVYAPLAVLAFTSVYGAVIAGIMSFVLVTEHAPTRRRLSYYLLPFLVCVFIVAVAWLTFPARHAVATGGSAKIDTSALVIAGSLALLTITGSAAFLLLRAFQFPARVKKIASILFYLSSSFAVFLSGDIFGMAFYSGGFFPANIWLFAFYLYLLPWTGLLFVFTSVTAVFSVFHYAVYPFTPLHQEMLLCLVISLMWIGRKYYTEVYLPPDKKTILNDIHGYRRKYFPWLFMVFLAWQAILGLVYAQNDIKKPYSASANVAQLILRTPAWRDAIIMGEPDYMLEPFPYYIDNPLYFPRARHFGEWTIFSRFSDEFSDHLTLGKMIAQAQALKHSTGKPVLILLEAGIVEPGKAGKNINGYGRIFEWTSDESKLLSTEARFAGRFAGAISDENYDVYELR